MKCIKSRDHIPEISRQLHIQKRIFHQAPVKLASTVVSFHFKVLQLFSLRRHVGRNFVEPERCRAMRTGTSETYACFRRFPKVFNGFRNHKLPARTTCANATLSRN
jgi:hypothetical protein